jgi:hypothetical protein
MSYKVAGIDVHKKVLMVVVLDAGRSSRQGCETYGVKVPFRQLLVLDG